MHDLNKVLKTRVADDDGDGGDTRWKESRYTEKDWLLNQSNSSYSGSYIEIKNVKRTKYNFDNFRFNQVIPMRRYMRDQELINQFEFDSKYSICDYVKWFSKPDKKGEISDLKKPPEFEPKKIEEGKRKRLLAAMKDKCQYIKDLCIIEPFEIEKKQRAILFNMLDSDRNGFLNFYEFFALVRIFQVFDQFSEGDIAVPSEAYMVTKEQIEVGIKTIGTPNTFGISLIKEEVEKLRDFKQ